MSNNATTTITTAQLSGNPYTDLANYGIDLHSFEMRHLRHPNPNGHTLTGRFNIGGRVITAGADTYAGLILFLVQKHTEHRQYVAECRARKKLRNLQSFLARYPQAATLPAYLRG